MKDELYSWYKYDKQFRTIGDKLNYEKYDERDSEYNINFGYDINFDYSEIDILF